MKTLCLILIFLGLAITGIEIINDFEKTKTFYASLNPHKYYYKDILYINNKISPSSISSNKTSWIFQGLCKSDKLKTGISIPKNIVEERGYFGENKISIWRIKIAKNVILYRRQNNTINSAFSYEMRNYWIGSLFIFMVTPAFICYIIIKRKQIKIH
ncbi:hypothetical protein [Flavobacterium branchiicola]|uniref:PepSY-associated transmembrane protein n=1 Tax=Flavobacterium branchiicola TaxID=1114875 RepID=A0ABV9PHG1_9FLAO|nr:hypothetical protein [Flavobacterium branchiicola]MBS7255852.1 hypothetical protein [Flavobacterium branchiicola]